jgi:hypothetical protein
MSMDASGQLGKALVFAKWKGQNYVRQYVIPMNPNTEDQAAIRDIVAKASVAWKNSATVGATPVNSAYKLAYNEAAAGSGMSGFNLFIKESIALNGGIAFTGTLEVPTVPGDVTPGA